MSFDKAYEENKSGTYKFNTADLRRLNPSTAS
jgi:hypothetical protein